MNFYLTLIVIVSIVFESAVIPYPLTLFVIGIISIFKQEEMNLLAFGSGILLDIFSVRTLGLSSLYFLLLLYLGTRYKKKIHGRTFVYRFGYLIIPYGVYSFLFYKNLNPANVLITAVLIFITLLVLERLFPITGSKKRLAV